MSDDDFPPPGWPGALLNLNDLPIAGIGDRMPAGDPFDFEGILKGNKSAKSKWDLGIDGFGFEEWGDYGITGDGFSGVNDGGIDFGTSWDFGINDPLAGLIEGAGIGFDADGASALSSLVEAGKKLLQAGTGEVFVKQLPGGVGVVVSDGLTNYFASAIGNDASVSTYVDGDGYIHVTKGQGTHVEDSGKLFKASPFTMLLHAAGKIDHKKTPDPEGDLRVGSGPLPRWARSRLAELWLRKPTSDTDWGSMDRGGTRATIDRGYIQFLGSGGVTDPVPYADDGGGPGNIGYFTPRTGKSDEPGGLGPG